MKVRFLNAVRPEEWPEGKGPAWKRGETVVIENAGLRQQVVQVAICSDQGKPLYDQILHWEAGGAVTLPVNQFNEIGLVEVDRPVPREPIEHALLGRDADYDRRWVENLGCKSLEAPRGMAKKNEKPGQTAAREGEEEIGSAIRKVTYLGSLADNTAFKPMPVHGYLAEVDTDKASKLPPDVNEKIFAVRWYPWNEVLRMLKLGVECPIDCIFTKAVLAHWFARRFAP